MAEPIIQKLGFETAQAVTNITAMDKALQGLNRRIVKLNKITVEDNVTKLGDGLDKVAKKAKNARQATDKVFTGMEKGSQKATNAITKITASWGGLAKALVARTAVQAITALTGAILDAADAAAEFEITVARISNIAKGPGSGIDELSRSLNQLSVDLGRPVTEVLEAAFEGLQNDLGNTADTMQFLGSAADDLALVTGGTLTQAVNSLSSVIKAYNLPISEAARISDQFFAAIDKGRISLEELESSLGKITPLAAKLDIEFGQVAGAMAAITQSGTSANVANTQLRSIFQKLLKPTEDLQKAFDKLGVETFNQLIERSGGLREALQAIAKAFDNDDRAIAKAFGRLRAQLGVFNLLSNEGRIFSETMDAVANSTGKAAEGADRIRGTKAFEAKKAWEEYNRTIRETGKVILELQTTLIGYFNAAIPNAQSLISIFEKVTAAAVGMGSAVVIAGLIALTGALGAAAAAASALAAPLIIGAAAGVALGELYKKATGDFAGSMQEIDDKVAKKMEEIAERGKAIGEQITKDLKDIMDSRGKVVDDYIKGMEIAFDKETALLRQSAKIVGKALENTISDFESGMNSMFDGMKSKLKNVHKELRGARTKAKEAGRDLNDFKFDKAQRGLSSFQKIENQISRTGKAAREMGKSVRQALKNPAAVGQAEADISRMETRLQELRALAEAEQNPVKRKEAVDAADRYEEKMLLAKKKLADAQVKQLNRIGSATEAVLNLQKAITAEMAEQLRLRAELASTLTAEGKSKSGKQFASDQKKLAEVDANLNKLASKLDVGLLSAFGNKEHAAKLVGNVIAEFNTAQYNFSNIRQQFEAKLKEEHFKVFVDLVINAPTTGSKQVDDAVAEAVEASKALGENPVTQYEARRVALLAELEKMKSAEKSYNESVERGEASKTAAAERAAVARTQIHSSDKAVAESLLEEFRHLQAELFDPSITAQKATEVLNAMNTLRGKIGTAFNKDKSIKENFTSALLEAITEAEKSMKERQIQIDLTPKFDKEVMANIDMQIRGTMKAGKDGADAITTAVGGIGVALGKLPAAAAPVITAMGKIEAAARAAAKQVAAALASGGGKSYHGGKVGYRASGGPTRGQDTLMTATAPGEFITNAASTRKWYSELQAMNAGQSPQYRDKGGPVTNNYGSTVGDVNVTVEGSATQETVRSITDGIERELRFGTSRVSRR